MCIEGGRLFWGWNIIFRYFCEYIRKCPYLVYIFYATKVKNIHESSFYRGFKSAKTRKTPCRWGSVSISEKCFTFLVTLTIFSPYLPVKSHVNFVVNLSKTVSDPIGSVLSDSLADDKLDKMFFVESLGFQKLFQIMTGTKLKNSMQGFN